MENPVNYKEGSVLDPNTPSECLKALVGSIVWLNDRLLDEQAASKPA